MAVKIITDSASDISQEYAKKLGVTVIPLQFTFSDGDYFDGVDMDNREFYSRLESEKELPKTSQISPYRYSEVFSKAVENGDDALYLAISSGVSGSVRNAIISAEEYGGKVKVIDSKHFCISLRVLVEYAKRLSDEGKNLDEIVELLLKAQSKVRIIAVFATLENLRKGGRLSSAAAFVGEALSIKPIVTIDNGGVGVLKKVKGMRNGYRAMREYIESEQIDLSMPYAFAYSGTDEENIDTFIKENGDLFDNKTDIEISYVGATVGTYAGPGAIAAAYFVK